jgi:hypothetical protein
LYVPPVGAGKAQLEILRFSLDEDVRWYSTAISPSGPGMRYEASSLRGWLERWLAA